MDDTCAVCAETLEWVAYGPCGHREVCATCVARLRCICDDRRCCICKSESDIIFVTKALGDFTRMINDFSVFPVDPTEGLIGSYWYHEETQAYFDDLDQYKMIKAMCRLSCSVCDKIDEQGKDRSRRKGRFRNIDQLKGHLFHQHKQFMCSLCLEGRKIFISEQKLYTRTQLNRHIRSGDSEVDGSESERGGFSGHPMCEFCRNPFYGENELYLHMSTEHYTCHICQRQNPGQYEYYKNYDDLEIHFRQEHFLCENDSCLAKKFVVFPSESEMKRHNAKEHGGHMSRSKRNAALQIPTSFRYRRSNEQDRRGRGRDFHRDSPDDNLSLAIQASLETVNANTSRDTESSSQEVRDHGETNEVDDILSSFESLARTGPAPPPKYREAVGQNSGTMPLASFPPLPVATSSSTSKSKNSSDELGANTIAALLKRQNGTVKVVKPSQGWPAASSSHSVPLSSSGPSQAWPAVGHQPTPSASSSHSKPVLNSGSSQAWPASVGHKPGNSHPKPIANPGPSSSSISTSSNKHPANGNLHSSFASSAQAKSVSASYPSSAQPRPSSASYASSAQARTASASPGNSVKSSSSSQSSPALSTSGKGPFVSSAPDFPPVGAPPVNKQTSSDQPLMKVGDVYTANKSLVERIREGLEFDEDKYGAFKVISAEYRQDQIGTKEYLAYVHQFGLSHLILELARLCPNAQKQKELVQIYNSSLQSNGTCELSASSGGTMSRKQLGTKKGKEKRDDVGTSNVRNSLSDGIMNTVKMLQSNYTPSEEVEVLSKDGYRSAKDKSKELRIDGDLELAIGSSKKNSKTEETGQKQRKKTSKFHRVRLGDGSAAALLDLSNSSHGSGTSDDRAGNYVVTSDRSQVSSDGLPIRGAWKNGGGQRLVAMNTGNPRK